MFKRCVISFVTLGLLILIVSLGSQPGVSQSTSVAPTPEMFQVKVLLSDSVPKVSFNARADYRVTDPVTMNVVFETQMPFFTDITASEDGFIKVGQKKYSSRRLVFEPVDKTFFAINDNVPYHGGLEIIVNSDNKTLMVINDVPLEDYIASVVPSEMPSYWESEALKAQAIAARTYVLYIKQKFGKNRQWDVKATQANQVYKGIRAETLRATDAVNSSAGIVLACQGNESELFPTYYSSVCAGHTENSVNVFGDDFEPLRGVDCPWCRFNTNPRLFYWPDAIYDKQTVSDNIFAKYPNLKEQLENIVKLEVAKESVYPSGFKRIISIRLTGSNGKIAFLRAEDLRLSVDPTGSKIQSTCFTLVTTQSEFLFIAGKGFGHGVGLCQYGAREMAKQGKSAKEILDYYYPGNRTKMLY